MKENKVMNKFEREKIASDINSSKETLLKLSNDKCYYVLSALGRNPSTPVEVLIKLSKHKSGSRVVWSVAGNPNTPITILIKLSKHKSCFVRQGVAKNISTPIDILIKLSKDKERYPICIGGTLLEYQVKCNVAENPNTPIEILEKLSNDENKSVRWSVINNKNVTKDILNKLSNDSSGWVKINAKFTLNTFVLRLPIICGDTTCFNKELQRMCKHVETSHFGTKYHCHLFNTEYELKESNKEDLEHSMLLRWKECIESTK
jgi:hypothetical protein